MESLVYFNDRGAYRNFLSQPAWIIARPLFALINLGWHVTTPLGMKKYFCTTKGVQHIAIFCDYLLHCFIIFQHHLYLTMNSLKSSQALG